jgi:hypothetical protein
MSEIWKTFRVDPNKRLISAAPSMRIVNIRERSIE